MDITEVKNNTLAALKSSLNFNLLWSMVKDAVKLPYAKTYIFLALLFTLLFGIVSFPYDILLRSSLKNLEKNILRSIYISTMDFSLFDVVAVNNVYIVLQSGSEIIVRSADLDISMFRLMFGKDITGSFQLNGLKYNAESVQMDLNLSGEGFIDFKSFDEMPQNGNFKIIINPSTLKIGEIALPDSMGGIPLSLPLVKIKSGNCEGEISTQKINITNMKIFGDISCTINGSIAMAKTFLSSRLDLKITADADSAILKDYRDFLGRFVNDRNQIVLAIRGSISRPYIDLSQSGSEAPRPRTNQPPDNLPPVRQ